MLIHTHTPTPEINSYVIIRPTLVYFNEFNYDIAGHNFPNSKP